MKKKYVVISIIVLILLMWIGYDMRGNVFDKVHRAFYTAPMKLSRVDELDAPGGNDRSGDSWHYFWGWYDLMGGSAIYYNKEALREDIYSAHWWIVKDSKERLDISVLIHINQQDLLGIGFSYDAAEKILYFDDLWLIKNHGHDELEESYYETEEVAKLLKEDGFTKQQLWEYKDYILYELALRPWVRTQGEIYIWEKLKLQNCTQIDRISNLLE